MTMLVAIRDTADGFKGAPCCLRQQRRLLAALRYVLRLPRSQLASCNGKSVTA